MIFISSLLGCRNCLQSDGIRHMYSLMDGDSDEYQEKTEFEVMTLLERWRAEDDKRCEFCGSSNVEVHEVEVSNYPLYDFDRLVERCKSEGEYLFMLNIDKRGSDISLRPGGSTKFHPDFLKDAILKIIDTINDRPNDNFVAQIKGNFFICVSGGFDFFSDKSFVRLERFRNSGLTRSELLSAIKPFATQVGISIDAEDAKKIVGSNSIFGKTFKGSLFTSWIYASKEEEAKGCPFSCASFNFDENTIIAIGTAHDESPRDFIDNNQRNTFIVDDKREPLTRGNQKIYFAKKI
jgi:hypothetical protein